ncbi:hypothetical protein chiPu_0019012 [Chiloscyllium punctatum]|uniref:Ig-like domain-containing protein n=1 Tax=Chiloscyllium punctatum TaxID=137246 RepID=A0A401RQL8_CHIPU|nr:hypothetical protein [Chiloscyllium punctatum]
MKTEERLLLIILRLNAFIPELLANEQIAQSPLALEAVEGSTVTMHCSTSALLSFVKWYQWRGGRDLKLLIVVSGSLVTAGKVQATLHREQKRSTLTISDVGRGDAAIYLCGVITTMMQSHEHAVQKPQGDKSHMDSLTISRLRSNSDNWLKMKLVELLCAIWIM